jgi:hypothetical protein
MSGCQESALKPEIIWGVSAGNEVMFQIRKLETETRLFDLY